MPVGWMAPGHGGLSAASSSRKRGAEKRPRSVRCGKCDGCERDDCGMCKNCVDKPKFGGLGQRKQGLRAQDLPRAGSGTQRVKRGASGYWLERESAVG